MSVAISGPTCCGGDAYVGGDSGTADTVRREASFSVPSAQWLLLTVYISVEGTRTMRFELGLTGSVGGTVGPTPSSVCTDLTASGLIGVSIAGTTRTIRGRITNFSANDFRSTVDRQWVELSRGAKETFVSLARVQFTEILAGRSFQVTATDVTPSKMTPRYWIRIIYSPLNATDALTTNDDCNPVNDSASGGLIRGIPLTKRNK